MNSVYFWARRARRNTQTIPLKFGKAEERSPTLRWQNNRLKVLGSIDCPVKPAVTSRGLTTCLVAWAIVYWKVVTTVPHVPGWSGLTYSETMLRLGSQGCRWRCRLSRTAAICTEAVGGPTDIVDWIRELPNLELKTTRCMSLFRCVLCSAWAGELSTVTVHGRATNDVFCVVSELR